MFGDIFDKVTDEISEFVESPISKTIEVATQPLRDGMEIFEGLTEGEIRGKAALRLGANVVSGMAFSEVIAFLLD